MSYPSGYIEQLARPLRSARRTRELPPRLAERRHEGEERPDVRQLDAAEFASERLEAVHVRPPRR